MKAQLNYRTNYTTKHWLCACLLLEAFKNDLLRKLCYYASVRMRKRGIR